MPRLILFCGQRCDGIYTIAVFCRVAAASDNFTIAALHLQDAPLSLVLCASYEHGRWNLARLSSRGLAFRCLLLLFLPFLQSIRVGAKTDEITARFSSSRCQHICRVAERGAKECHESRLTRRDELKGTVQELQKSNEALPETE